MELTSITFYLYYEILKGMGAVKQDLVGHARRNADDVSGGEFLPDPTPNGSIALLVWSQGFSIHQSTAEQQCCRTRLDEKNVGLSLVPLDRTIGLSVDLHKTVLGEIRELFHGKMMGVG